MLYFKGILHHFDSDVTFKSNKIGKLAFEIIKLKFGDFGYLSMHGSSNANWGKQLEVDVTIFDGREIIYQLPTQWLSDNF